MTEEIKRIDIKEFRAFGYLQELNRQFLHPLGLALEVFVNEDGTERLGGVWDYRDDPEGMNYGNITQEHRDRAGRVCREQLDRAGTRKEAIGYVIQPLD